MAKDRNIDLVFPFGGLHEQLSPDAMPSGGTPSCSNVMPEDTYEHRMRGGSRPGLTKQYSTRLGTASEREVRLVDTVTLANGYTSWDDDFDDDALADVWGDATWIGNLPKIYDEEATLDTDTDCGTVLDALDNWDSDMAYVLEMYVSPVDDSYEGQYKIFARMNDDTPVVTTDGIVATLTMDDDSGDYEGTLDVYVASAKTSYNFTGGSDGEATANWFKVLVIGDTVKCYWGDVLLLNQAISTQTGTRFGFGMTATTVGGVCVCDEFRVQYHKSSFNLNDRQTILIASAGAKFYREQFLGVMNEESVGAVVLPTDRRIRASEWHSKVYLALDTPAVYDPETNSLAALTASEGTVPTNCRLIETYRDRIVLAGNLTNPNLWYMSKSGDATDWDYTAEPENPLRAFYGQGSEAGQPGMAIKAIIAFQDDYMIMAGETKMYVMRGDPGYGGGVYLITDQIGIIDDSAWCKGPKGELYFVARNGLNILPPGSNSSPELLSKAIPNRLKEIQAGSYHVELAYDPIWNGLHIYTTPESTSGDHDGHFFYCLETGGFFPWAYASNDHEPFSMVTYQTQNPSYAGVLLGCRDGYIRRHSATQTTDDGTTITSYVDLGPFAVAGRDFLDGRINQIITRLDDGSGAVTVSVKMGETAQAAADASNFNTFTAAAGLNYNWRPRARGGWAVVRLTATTRWAMERITLVLKALGRLRKP